MMSLNDAEKLVHATGYSRGQILIKPYSNGTALISVWNSNSVSVFDFTLKTHLSFVNSFFLGKGAGHSVLLKCFVKLPSLHAVTSSLLHVHSGLLVGLLLYVQCSRFLFYTIVASRASSLHLAHIINWS